MYNRARLGGPIFLIVLGAVLYFALKTKQAGGFDLDMIGLIGMFAGALWLVLELLNSRRTAVSSTKTAVSDPNAPDGVSVKETESRSDLL